MTALHKNQPKVTLKSECLINERCTEPLVKISNISYLVIKRPNIEKAAKFFVDYGLLVDHRSADAIYLRGTSEKSHCVIIEEQDTLGMIVSDFQFLENDPLPIVAFMRCDNGKNASDHHTLGLGAAVELGHQHSAFELDTMEDIAIADGDLFDDSV